MTDHDLYADSPAPLEVFEKKVVHEDNQLLLSERLEFFKAVLPRAEYKRLRKRVKALHRQLNKAGYNELIQQRQQIADELLGLKEAYAGLRADLTQNDSGDQRAKRLALRQYKQVRERGRQLCAQGKAIQAQIEALQPLHDEYRESTHRLNSHETAIKERKEQQQQEKRYVKESRIILSLLNDVLRNTPGCHNLSYHQNKRICEIPSLKAAGFNGDSHWFLLEGSVKSWDGYHQMLPYGVHTDNLISEKTLHNMSVALNRQVEVRRSQTGSQIYFLVNRLDSPDGLPRLVRFRSMFEFYPQRRHPLLPWPAGVMAQRRVQWNTFGELPHLLIAGSSQTGKSNQVNCIIATIVQMNRPAECRLVLIDNKAGVEFGFWEELPHLLTPTVKDIEGVLPAFDIVLNIMHRRFNILQATKAKKLEAYNAKVPEKQRWARIVVFVDEMATLIQHKGISERVHEAMNLIASMGRATGIHLVISTQYPSADITPSVVKANLAATMTGAMPSGQASMSALGNWDAKDLARIPGRMLISIGSDMEEVQTAYITDQDIEAAVLAAKKYGEAPPLLELEGPDSENYIPIRTIGVADVIEAALDLKGQLSAKKIYKYLGDDAPSVHQLERLVRKVTSQDVITHNDVVYRIKREARAYYLVESTNGTNSGTEHLDNSSESLDEALEEIAV